jgi:phospholipid transport system substrate-binding protein
MYKSWLIIGLLLVQLNLPLLAEESPTQIIKARNQNVEDIITAAGDNIDDATRDKLKDVINSFIDFRELSRVALGKYWKERTEQEKDDFVSVFEQLIRNSSVKKLEVYKADRIEYDEPEIRSGKAFVRTVAYKKKKQVEVLYKMHQVDGEWKVYDLEIDGLSTARNYRDSFYKQISTTSYEEMYEKLVTKLNEG